MECIIMLAEVEKRQRKIRAEEGNHFLVFWKPQKHDDNMKADGSWRQKGEALLHGPPERQNVHAYLSSLGQKVQKLMFKSDKPLAGRREKR